MGYSAHYQTLVAFICMLLLASCAGSGSTPGAAAPDAKQPPPPLTADTAGPVTGSLVPDVASVLRQPSATAEERFKYGSGYLPGAYGNLNPHEQTVTFIPSYDPGTDPMFDDVAFAVYKFHLPDYSVSTTLTMDWGAPLTDWGDLWVGAGRVSTLAWDWLATDGATVEFADLAPYLNETDDLVIAIVLTGTVNATLDWLRIGDPVGPVADLTVDPAGGNLPLNVTFDATGSYGRDAALTNIIWDFDGDGLFSEDGTPETAAAGNYQPEYTFETSGTHTVFARVTDEQVLSDTASVEVEVVDPILELSGRVADGEDTPLSGIDVALSGDATDTATTDADGIYTFSLAPGSYTVEPSGYGWFFNPKEQDVELVLDPETNVDFTAVGPWLHTWGGSEEDRIDELVIDADDNVYAVGRTMSFTSGSGDREVLIQKYNCYGELEWTRTWGGTENEIGKCATLGNNGDLYVTGYTTSFGEGGYDVFVLKINPDGTFEWQTVWGNIALQEAFDIAVDPSENLYVAGRLSNKTLLLKLDSSGQHQWGELYWGDGSDFNYANEIVISDPHIYLAGHTYYTDNYNGLVLQYDMSGTLLWAKEWSSGTEDMFDCVGVDSGGGVVCAGHTNNGNGAHDGLLVGLNSSGTMNFQQVWGSDKFELFYGMEIVDDKAYLAGMFGDSGRAMLLCVNAVSGIIHWGQGFNMDVGAQTATSYGVGAFDNGAFIVGGVGPNINGYWEPITGTPFATGGTLVDPTVKTNNTNTAGIVQSAISGTIGTPLTGVVDTGGGGSDAAMLMYLPPE